MTNATMMSTAPRSSLARICNFSTPLLSYRELWMFENLGRVEQTRWSGWWLGLGTGPAVKPEPGGAEVRFGSAGLNCCAEAE